jgi:hypothetical protein
MSSLYNFFNNQDIQKEVVENKKNIFGDIIYSTIDYEIVKITDFRKFIKKVKSWEGNRLVSTPRVKKIKRSFHSNKNIHCLSISLVNVNGSLIYYLWDGQHRYEAIKLCCQEYDDLSFLNNFICHIYKNDTEDNMKKRFIIFNQAIPVPGFYIDELLKDKKELNLKKITENIIKRLKQEFPFNVSTSKLPRKPNFNPDMISDLMYNFLKDNNLENIDEEELWAHIMYCNEYYKETLYIKSEQTKIRAKHYNCYLFCNKHFFMNDIKFNTDNSDLSDNLEID